MSDAFYQTLLLKVNPIIERFGTKYPVRGQGTYDNESMTTIKPEAREIIGLVSNSEMLSGLGGTSIAGLGGKAENTAKAWIGKKLLLLQANANPLQGDEVQVDGNWFPLSKIQTIKPANIILLYILDVTI